MIQRIQSVWLLLAALLNAGLFFFDIYHAHVLINGVDTLQRIYVSGDFGLLILALVTVLLPAIAIFLFKNRKQQRSLVLLGIVANIGFIALELMKVANFNSKTPAPANGSYWIGAVLPVISVIFLFMALSGIRKDEKLIKSLDRLR